MPRTLHALFYLLFEWAAKPPKICHFVTVFSVLSPDGGVASRKRKKELAVYVLCCQTAQKACSNSLRAHLSRALVRQESIASPYPFASSWTPRQGRAGQGCCSQKQNKKTRGVLVAKSKTKELEKNPRVKSGH